jgi:hypothetical protein
MLLRAWFTIFLLLYSVTWRPNFQKFAIFSLLYPEERRGLCYSSSFSKLPVLAIRKPSSYFKHLKL